MDYTEMLFALHIRQEAVQRIADEDRAGVATTGTTAERLKECIDDLVGATKGVAHLIREQAAQ